MHVVIQSLLAGVCRLWVKVSLRVHRGLLLNHGHIVGLHIVRGQSPGHRTQAGQGQLEQLLVVPLETQHYFVLTPHATLIFASY